jgi:Na+-driven multidrug efflux pump
VATGQAVVIMTAVAILFLAIPRELALIFTNEFAVVPLIVSYLRINAISEPLLAVNMVLRGALQGAGDTRFPMWTTVGTLWVLRLPLAWALSIPTGLEATGAWIAMSVTTAVSGIIMAVYFKSGHWRKIRV